MTTETQGQTLGAARRRSSTAGTLKALLVSLRPQQWTKNLILFAAIIFSGDLDRRHAAGPRRRGLRALLRALGLRIPHQRCPRPGARQAARAQEEPAHGGRGAEPGAGGHRGRRRRGRGARRQLRARPRLRRRRRRLPGAAAPVQLLAQGGGDPRRHGHRGRLRAARHGRRRGHRRQPLALDRALYRPAGVVPRLRQAAPRAADGRRRRRPSAGPGALLRELPRHDDRHGHGGDHRLLLDVHVLGPLQATSART